MSGNEACKEDEGSEEQDDQSPRPTVPAEEEEPKRSLKPPDREKNDRDIEKLNAKIREKEGKLTSLQRTPTRSRSSSNSSNHAWKDRDTLMAELRGFKAEKEKDIESRKKIDQELRGLTSMVQQKNDACGKLQAGLKYKTETKTDEAIRRLEHQLHVQQLKLREEKRIVSEINTLKRSKKMIHEFVSLKQYVDQLREKQRLLRFERDNCTKRISGLKAKEEDIKVALDEQKMRADEVRSQQREFSSERSILKKEIDELYDLRREQAATFNREKNEYYNNLKETKLVIKQKRKDEVSRRAEERRKEHNKEMKSQTFSRQPHEGELALCATLIDYMERLNIVPLSDGQTPTQPLSDGQTPTHDDTTSHQPQQGDAGDGMFLKRKTDDDLVGLYAGHGRKMSRRASKKGRRMAGKETPKKLVLHPHVVEQFYLLHVSPPSTAADIPKTINELNEKKMSFTAVLPESWSTSSSIVSAQHSLDEDFPSLPPPLSLEVHSASYEADASIQQGKDGVEGSTSVPVENLTAKSYERREELIKDTDKENSDLSSHDSVVQGNTAKVVKEIKEGSTSLEDKLTLTEEKKCEQKSKYDKENSDLSSPDSVVQGNAEKVVKEITEGENKLILAECELKSKYEVVDENVTVENDACGEALNSDDNVHLSFEKGFHNNATQEGIKHTGIHEVMAMLETGLQENDSANTVNLIDHELNVDRLTDCKLNLEYCKENERNIKNAETDDKSNQGKEYWDLLEKKDDPNTSPTDVKNCTSQDDSSKLLITDDKLKTELVNVYNMGGKENKDILVELNEERPNTSMKLQYEKCPA